MLTKLTIHVDEKPEGVPGAFDFSLDHPVMVIENPNNGTVVVDTAAGRRFAVKGTYDEVIQCISS